MNKLLDRFNEKSAEIKTPVDESTFTAREAVKLCLKGVRHCRKRKIPWDTIADNIRESVLESYGISISLTGSTTQRYYYALINKKKGKKSKLRSRSTSATSRKSKASAQPAVPVPATEPTPESATTPEPVARSPAVEPELETASEATDSPSESVATIPSLSERLRSTRNPRTPRGYENCKTK